MRQKEEILAKVPYVPGFFAQDNIHARRNVAHKSPPKQGRPTFP